jgi:hypothetical protein
MPSDTVLGAEFSTIFRRELYDATEYSFTTDPTFLGTMTVGSSSDFVSRSIRFGECHPNHGAWVSCFGGVVSACSPEVFFFKVDWKGGLPISSTLYGRKLTDAQASEAATALLPVGGIDVGLLREVAATLLRPGPSIIGVQLDRFGNLEASAYVVADLSVSGSHGLMDDLAVTMGTGCESTEMMHTFLADIDRSCDDWPGDIRRPAVQAMGIGFPGPVLKVDVAHVPVRIALDALDAVGNDQQTLDRLARAADAARRPEFSYVALKGGAVGPASWKVYVAMSEHFSPGRSVPGRVPILTDSM